MSLRGASVLPAIMLAVAVSAVTVLILSGVLYFYASITNEPAVLPTYGSVYVSEANQTTGEVVVVNRFGYPVMALISVELNTTAVARDFNATPANALTQWVVLGPGETRINVYDIVRQALGVSRREYVVWSRSGVLVGNMFFVFKRGVGAPIQVPDAPRGSKSRVYLLQGLGTSSTGNGTVFSTLAFTQSSMSVEFEHGPGVGYYRTICGYRPVTATIVYAYGQACKYERCTCRCCANVTCVAYNEKGECISTTCINNAPLDYRCDYVTSPQSVYNTYECGLDGYLCLYLHGLRSSLAVPVKSQVLRGAMQDPTGWAGDVVSASLPTVINSTVWEYILPRESMCDYNYTEYEYTASISTTTECCRMCDSSLCCVTRSVCTEDVRLVRRETRNACTYYLGSPWKCASRRTFLRAQAGNATLRVEVRQISRGVMLVFNVTEVISYTRWFDPELGDSSIRFVPFYRFRLNLPRITGFVSIPYTENIESAAVGVNGTVVFATISITTSTGTTFTRQLPSSFVWWYEHANYVPVNAIELPPNLRTNVTKVFQVFTMSSPYVEVYALSRQDESLPLCECRQEGCSCGDSFRVSISVGVVLYPYVRVATSG